MANMLAGLKDAFSPKALKTALTTMAGGGAAGVLHILVSKEIAWMGAGEFAWVKRAGLAALIGTVGASLVAKKSCGAADGITGAMGAVIAYEIYNKVRPTAQSRVSGLLSNLARTSVLTEGAGGRMAGTRVMKPGQFAGVQRSMAGTY